jgi:hypothetical protein
VKNAKKKRKFCYCTIFLAYLLSFDILLLYSYYPLTPVLHNSETVQKWKYFVSLARSEAILFLNVFIFWYFCILTLISLFLFLPSFSFLIFVFLYLPSLLLLLLDFLCLFLQFSFCFKRLKFHSLHRPCFFLRLILKMVMASLPLCGLECTFKRSFYNFKKRIVRSKIRIVFRFLPVCQSSIITPLIKKKNKIIEA